MYFFNSAVIACAVIRLQGGDPTVADGFKAAVARLPHIFGWAVVSAVVGVLLRLIESKSERAGEIVSAILGAAWAILTFLVVPIMVVERKDPITALKESASLLRKTFGTQIIGNFSFGLVFLVVSLPGVIVIAVGVLSGVKALLIACVGIGALYLVTVALVQSALQSIFQAAVYLYARGGEVPPGFQADFVEGAFGGRRPRRRRRRKDRRFSD
jgi:hypothetical protein